MSKMDLNIDGETVTVDCNPDMPLLWVLRDRLGKVGTRFGCGAGLCGACTVHFDGQAVRSCQLPVGSVGDARIVTVEHLENSEIGRALQEAWLEEDVVQCGYCQSGQLMSASSLLASTPSPDDQVIDAAMAGNLCRCATYVRIRAAIRSAARKLGGE